MRTPALDAAVLVVVGESVTVVANCDHCLIEINKANRADVLRNDVCVSPSIHWMQRILPEHVFDVCDEQFLMLLFMMNTEHKKRLDCIKQLVPCVSKQVIDV